MLLLNSMPPKDLIGVKTLADYKKKQKKKKLVKPRPVSKPKPPVKPVGLKEIKAKIKK